MPTLGSWPARLLKWAETQIKFGRYCDSLFNGMT
jgi:hypothetical protein